MLLNDMNWMVAMLVANRLRRMALEEQDNIEML